MTQKYTCKTCILHCKHVWKNMFTWKKKNVSTNLTLRTWNSFFIFLDLSFRYHTTLFVLATVDEVGVICEAHCEHLLHCQQFAHAIGYITQFGYTGNNPSMRNSW